MVDVEDKWFFDGGGIIAPIGAGLLYGLSDGIDPTRLLDYYVGKIHTVRVFAGRLTPSSSRTGQSPGDARERLQTLCGLLRERSLRVEVTCCNDTAGVPYNEKQHVRELAVICEANGDVVIGMEIWNEIGHPTQRPISYNELIELKNIAASVYQGPIALGASSIDELDVETGKYPSAWTGPNAYSTVHLNRNKKPSYREACRIKELYDIRNKHNCGGCNNEPGRFDAPELNEPDGMGHERFAYILGVLGMGFNFMSIAHGSQMRDCLGPLTGVEEAAFNAYLRAASLIPRGGYQWQNANNTGNWPNSPVKNGAFAEGPANSNDKALWRAYSFVGGPIDFVVACGENPEKFNLEYQNGYSPDGLLDESFKVQVIKLKRN